MKKLLFIILSICTLACEKDKNPDAEIVEAIYKTIIKAELQKDKTLGVLDKAANNTYLDLDGFTSLFDKKDSFFRLQTASFKGIKLYSSDSLRMYANIRNEKDIKFEEFMPSYKSGIMMIINIPFFNKDKSKAITEITLANPVKETFYSRFYMLEKKGGNYVIINTRTLNSSGNVIDEDSITYERIFTNLNND